MTRRHPIALITLAGVLALPTTALAFERTLTCLPDNPVSPFRCLEDEQPIPIYWPSRCVGYHVNDTTFGSIDTAERLLEEIDLSFEAWNEIPCSYVEFVNAGETNETRIGYARCADPAANVNAFLFVGDGWTHQINAVALTSVTYDVANGRILDADIEMNAEIYNFGYIEFPWSQTTIVDVRNTLTHEVGHFLGLDHTRADTFVPDEGEENTDFREATMFAETGAGEVKKRSLHPDDIAGLCDIYPIEDVDSVPACDIPNEGFFTAPPVAPGQVCETERKGCACTATNDRRTGVLSIGIVALFLLGARRRRRR